MVHSHDDRTRSQKQQGFEESMRHQMEYGHRVSRCAQGDRHIAQLRQGGVSHHPLDVVLHNAQKPHEQGSDGAHHHDEVQGGIRQLEQR